MAGLRVWAPDGLQIIDTGTSVALILGSVLLGGNDQTQSGSFTDDRLLLGRPYFLVTTLEVNGFIGYRPNVSFSGNVVSWSWPPQYGGTPYPRCRFIYGLK
ncbi:hypothetical protein [Sphingomonas azotifigens]|uniref:hypothetical protein n=1 Tax=Sphingomonas azotifigens TaxID=330920 RepID=UPI000A0675A3|nr:hypothetical protein [Sphingomonas azotifigens]